MPVFLKKDKWLALSGLIVLLGSLLGGYYLFKSWRTTNIVTLPIPNCDLNQGPCVSSLPSGERVELRIKPTHMPVLTSLQLEVKTDKIPVKKIFIYFKGQEMNMGEFRYTLNRQKDGSYTAQTILPTCIDDNMAWQAIIHIEALNKQYSAPFVIVNQRPAPA